MYWRMPARARQIAASIVAMRASRLLSLLMLLQARGRLSAAAAARELEVSVRTVYRDADHLSAAGVPVYADRGRNGGLRLLDGFGTALTSLTAADAEALALSSVTQAATDLGRAAGAVQARRKMIASLPTAAGAGAAHIGARFHLDPLPWYGRREPPTTLHAIADAVWRDRRLCITYEGWEATRRRTISPLGLVMKAGSWYLVGAARSRPRTYRIDAIRTLEVLDSAAHRPAGFELARYWAESSRAFEAQLYSETWRVRLDVTGQRLLRDFHPRAWQVLQTQARVPVAGGWIEASLPFEHGEQGVRDALRMGAHMQVLAPAQARAAVATEARRCARLHAGRTGR
jgi:predicted DNA-binding transcriptional regulator YafY